MTTQIGIGFSREINTSTAARDAAYQVKTQTKQLSIDVAVVFMTLHYGPLEALRVIRQTLNETKLVGCSTAAIILSDSIETRGIAVLGISSSDMKFGVGSVSNLTSVDMRVAGAELARSTAADFGQNRRSLFLMFYDGLIRNNSFMVKGMQEVFGRVFPVLGASSSDHFQYKETYQFSQDKPLTNSASALLVGGQAHIGFGCRHGWKPLGKPRTITKVQGNIIKTIDTKRASYLYEEYLGLTIEELRSHQMRHATILYPLGIFIEGEKEYLLRNIVDILTDGSIICQGEIPENAEIHLMISNKDFCKQAACSAAYEVRDALLGRHPKLIMIFESLARHQLMGRDALEEIQMVREILGVETPLVGMYSFAEVAPLKSLAMMGEASLQNGTTIVLAIE